MLWNRSLVMMDKETQSLWSHILGEAMGGKLKGSRLEAIPADMVTWKAWKQKYPKTTVLNLRRTHRNYTRGFYRAPDRFVVGLVLNGLPYHCSFSTLEKDPLLNIAIGKEKLLLSYDPKSTSARLFARQLGEKTLTFEVQKDGAIRDKETGSLWDRTTGTAVSGAMKGKQLEARVGIVSYRRAWQVFHPKSREIKSDP